MTSHFLRNVSESELTAKVAALRNSDSFLRKIMPGTIVDASSVEDALIQADLNFHVAKWPLFYANPATIDAEAIFEPISSDVATVRTDTGAKLGIVGAGYGVVQTRDSLQALDTLVSRGEVKIRTVQAIGNGARIRFGALLGATEFPSLTGQPNTICHLGLFEASHDGSAQNSAVVYDVRLQCMNGMTSRSVVTMHKLKHTSKANDRLEAYSVGVLSGLIGDVEAEAEIFRQMAEKRMLRSQFVDFATDLVGGATTEEDSQTKQTRRANEVAELVGYFDGGNQGAGATAWGAYNSVTRWLEAKREAMSDGIKAAKRFESNLSGDGQSKIQKALKALR